MKSTSAQTRYQRHLQHRQTGGEQTDELFINNPDHPVKATEQGNQTHEVDFVEGQDHKPHQNPAERIPDDINTQER